MLTTLVEPHSNPKRGRQRPVKNETMGTRVLRLRLKDKHDAWLTQCANEGNLPSMENARLSERAR